MDQQTLVAAITEHLPLFASELTETMYARQLDTYVGIPKEVMNQMTTAALTAFMNDILIDKPHFFNDYWRRVTPARAEAGAKVEDMFTAVFASLDVLNTFAATQTGDDHALYNWWLRKGYSVAHDSMILLSQMFANVREQIISQQDAHIRELSTPIMPLYHGILALPLVGAFDAHRAGQVMETLLSGISQQQADVVIIDITGVPMVDTNVANYLLMAARAARLLGAQIILVGISAEIAQTLVQLGADLTGMATRANLQSGIEYALAMQGLAIAPRS